MQKAKAQGKPAAIYEEEDAKSAAPFQPEVTSGTETRLAGHRTVRIATIAVALMVTASLALVVRVIQLRGGTQTMGAPDAPASATAAKVVGSTRENEPAIGLGIARPITTGTAAAAATASARSTASAAKPDVSLLRPAVTIPTPPAANDCEDPFYVDAKGARHPKPHCFRH
jgi:hypothetical protein